MADKTGDATGSQNFEQRLRKLEDDAAITDLLFRYAKAIDGCRWTEWEQCFVEDCRAEFPFGSYDGRRGMGAWCAKNLVTFKAFQHIFSNIEIKLEGDRATVRNNAWIACIMAPDRAHEHFDNGAIYEWDLDRLADGWRIKRVRISVVWLLREASRADPFSWAVPR